MPLQEGKIELRHVTGQTEPNITISYGAHQMQQSDMVSAQVPVDVLAGECVAVIYDDQWWPGTGFIHETSFQE